MRLIVLYLVLLLTGNYAFSVVTIFSCKLRDINCTEYTVKITVEHKKERKLTVDDIGAGGSEGDRVINGTFFMTLQAKNWPNPKRQNVSLFGFSNRQGQFNIKRDICYVVHSYKECPEILCFEQTGDNSNNRTLLFYINNKSIKLITVDNGDHRYDDCIYCEVWEKGHRLRHYDDHKFSCIEYLQGLGLYRKYVWEFNTNIGRFNICSSALYYALTENGQLYLCGIISNGIPMAPLKEYANLVGYKWDYDIKKKIYKIHNNKIRVEYLEGTNAIKAGGKIYKLPHESVMSGGVLYVPFNLFSKVLGVNVVNTKKDERSNEITKIQNDKGKYFYLIFFKKSIGE